VSKSHSCVWKSHLSVSKSHSCGWKSHFASRNYTRAYWSHTRACVQNNWACLSNIFKNWHGCVWISHTNVSFSHVCVSIRHAIYYCEIHFVEPTQFAPEVCVKLTFSHIPGPQHFFIQISCRTLFTDKNQSQLRTKIQIFI
jgi:hypothetical protein